MDVPPFVVGANVVDHPDDEDGDPGNDGLRGYSSPPARRTLGYLDELGLTGVVLPVEVYAASASATEVRPSSLATGEGLDRLGRMIDDAHAEGLIVVVVPHLLLDDNAWRGSITLTGAEREAFFDSYTDVIRPIAEVAEAHCAEAFSFAVELKGLSHQADSGPLFAQLIADVRAVFDGGLTYSANWDEAAGVPFWPALDGIAVNAFFPLSQDPAATQADLDEGARRAQRRLLALQRAQGKPLWLLEVGFKAVPSPWVKPWLWPAQVKDRALPVDEEAQRRAYRAVIRAVRAIPAASGIFFWVVSADPDDEDHPLRFEPRQGFSFVDKAAAREVGALAAEPPPR